MDVEGFKFQILVARVDNLEELAYELGCRVGELLFSYLGHPLSAFFKSVETWDRVEVV